MPKQKTDEITTVPALVVTPTKAPAVSGNFEVIKRYLQGWKRKVTAMEMTEDNMEEVRVIKKEAVQYRNSLTKIQSDVKKLYFNDPKAVFDANMGTLLAVIGEVEKAADDVLAKEEQERLDGINEILDHYKAKFQEQYGLAEPYLARIEYKKNYYNKTTPAGYPSMDKFQKDDIEQQFKALKKEMEAIHANIRLVKATCEGESRLNVMSWIKQLDHSDVATVIEEITAERQRLRDLDRTPLPEPENTGTEDAEYEIVDENTEEPSPEEAGSNEEEKIVLGVTSGIDFTSDFKGRNKELKIKITYPCDLSDALTEVFKRLTVYGIKLKVIEEVAF
jgi:hypothetical protein